MGFVTVSKIYYRYATGDFRLADCCCVIQPQHG